jgi:hypothetical protein
MSQTASFLFSLSKQSHILTGGLLCKLFWQRGSSRLYTAFIDFKQAYDTIFKSKMWDHLRKNQMPIHMLSILENLYNADEYTLLDGGINQRLSSHFLV